MHNHKCFFIYALFVMFTYFYSLLINNSFREVSDDCPEIGVFVHQLNLLLCHLVEESVIRRQFLFLILIDLFIGQYEGHQLVQRTHVIHFFGSLQNNTK